MYRIAIYHVSVHENRDNLIFHRLRLKQDVPDCLARRVVISVNVLYLVLARYVVVTVLLINADLAVFMG